MCKKLIMSQSEAENKVYDQRINQLNNNKKYRRVQVHAYYCKKCKGWHTTTIPSSCHNKS